MKERIRIRRDSEYNWNFYNPVLATGEAGYETDTNRLKIGNGSGTWADLPYLVGGSTSVLKLGDGGTSDALLWYTSDRLNLVGSGGTSIFFDPCNNTIKIGSPTGISFTKSNITGVLGYLPQPTGNYSLFGHAHTLSDISGLIQSLNSKQGTGIYASGDHKHVISDVSGLALALSLKQPSGDYAATNHIHQLFISNGSNRVITYNSNEDLKIKGSGGTNISFNDVTNTITIGSISSISDLTNIVLTTGNQSISGIKNFNNPPIFISGFIGSGNTFVKLPNTSNPTHISVLSNNPENSAQLLQSVPVSIFVPSGRNISAGSGLLGGGTLNSDISLHIGQGDGIIVSNDTISINNSVVRTTGNQSISGIKTFTSGIFTDYVSAAEGVFNNLFTNSIDLIGNNNKLFLTAGTGILFYFHDSDNILEISADADVNSIGDTLVLRSPQGDIKFRNAYASTLYAENIIGLGGQFYVLGSGSILLDTQNLLTTNNGFGVDNIIIGSYNDGYGDNDIYVQLGLADPYPASTGLICLGNNNIYKASNKSFIIGNDCAVSGNNSIVLGTNSTAISDRQMVYANGKFQYRGDSQKMTYLVRGITLGNESSVLTLDGLEESIQNRLSIPPETTWAFYGQISAYDYAGGYGAAFNIRGGIRRNQYDETKLIGSFIKESWIEPELEGVYVSITADDTNESLKIEGLGKLSTSIKWTCELNVIQNSNGGIL